MKIKYCTIYFVFILCFNSVFSQTSSGEILLDGIISAENNQIKNIADPSELQDAVTKNYLNGIINDLQSQIEELQQAIDNDSDGFSENQGDCDDTNVTIYPGAEELIDGIDNDCDGQIDESTAIEFPEVYSFERNGASTIAYAGQTIRLMQADELYAALNDASSTQFTLDLMFGGDGSGSAGFADPALNGTSKIIRSKTAASILNGSSAVKAIFDGWLAEFANDVAPNLFGTASPGVAGMLGGYQLNAAGQELDQLFFKSLIGAFALDQIINNYITPFQLDSGTRRADNTAGILEDGHPYTTMEHKWDEGFGYLYGQVSDIESNYGLPADGESSGNLLMKYFNKLDQNYQPGIAETVYNAFIAGRHAITIADYDARDASAFIIKTELSKVVGIYAVHYLNYYLYDIQSGDLGGAFHGLSEAYGNILSLQFTNDGYDSPYFSNAEVNEMLSNLTNFWTVNESDILQMIEAINARFNF